MNGKMNRRGNGKKRVLNTQIAQEEYQFLHEIADRHSMTVTMVLRNLIRDAMKRDQGREKSIDGRTEARS